MTVEPLVHDAGKRWTVDDLAGIPDDGMRYEIFDGSLLVSPMPKNRHVLVTDRIARLLKRQAPPGVFVTGVGLGLLIDGGESYFIPDVIAVRDHDIDPDAAGADQPFPVSIDPAEVFA